MDFTPGIVEIALGAALLVAGALLGRQTARPDEGLRTRVRELEELLFEEREQRSSYEVAVAKHFGQTSDLFRDLTHQYTALYAHLAEGSRELVASRHAELAAGFDEPGLLVPSPGGPSRGGARQEPAPEASPSGQSTPEPEAPREDLPRAG